MNNSLKLFFLIFNLVPSLTSSVNNFYQPLSETELQMGQNASQIVERGGKLILHGGMKVDGITFSRKIPGLSSQRPCTLGFPVVKYDKYFGFLTSYSCANSNIFAEETEVGKAGAPGAFIPEKGLDYTYVLVYSDYWSEEVSRKITHSRCDKGSKGIDQFIPLMPTPSQPPYPGFTVCAYGAGSGYVCGEIMGFDNTIKVRSPIDEEDYQFSGLTKVKMNKPYSRGDLGAPVYIPLQIPDSTQMIASPVGQVIEVVGEKEKNIWYYIPLDRILEESELEIVTGDLSSLLPPKPDKPNNENLNNVPLADNLTTNSNVSEVVSNHFDKRQMQVLFTRAGLEVVISPSPASPAVANVRRRCTLGFAIRKDDRHGAVVIDHGFLMLGSCLASDQQHYNVAVFYLRPTADPDRPEVIRLGSVSRLTYVPSLGLDYALLNLAPNTGQRILWEDRLSTLIHVPGEGVSANVIAHPFVPGVGPRICAGTGYSNNICGTVTEPSARITALNFWHRNLDYWQNLIKVRLNTIPRAWSDGVRGHDFGSPVYRVRERDAEGRITKVQPVGILFDYAYEESEDSEGHPICEMYMYCVSIYAILLNNHELQLIGTPPQQ